MIPDEMQKERIPWTQVCVQKDPDALDLLDKMLTLDHNKRISAKDALAHPFFNEIRWIVTKKLYLILAITKLNS